MTIEYYDRITRLIMIELRGKNTQMQMSAKIGFKYNKWAKWESGQKRIMWNEFMAVLNILKINIYIDLSEILNKQITIKTPENEILHGILKKYGGLDDPEIFKKLNISKSTLYRKLTNSQAISLAFFFHLLDFLSSTFPQLLKAILSNPTTPELKKLCSKLDSHFDIEGRYPWISAIEGVLETSEYKNLKKHSDHFIAKKFNISSERVKFALKILINVGAIKFSNNKYILTNNQIDLTNTVTASKFMKYWTQVALNRFNTPDGVPLPREGWHTKVFSVSREAQQKITDARRRFESEYMKILNQDASTEKDELQVLLLHLFDEEELKNAKLL